MAGNVRLAVRALGLEFPSDQAHRLDLQKIPARNGRPDLVCVGVGGAKGSWVCVDAVRGTLVLREHLPLHVRFDYGAPKEFACGPWPSDVHLIDAGRNIGRLIVEQVAPLDVGELLKAPPPPGAEILFVCKEARDAELDPRSKVKPTYPPELLHLREPGYAYLQIGIDERGRVIDPHPLRASHPRFVEASVEAVKQWRYRPATCEGRPRRVESEVMVTFER